MASTKTLSVDFVSYLPGFEAIVGGSPTAVVVAETDTSSGLPLFHEACIYHPPSRSILVTSNQFLKQEISVATNNKQIRLSRIYDDGRKDAVVDITSPRLARSMLNGGVNYSGDSVLLCAQGTLDLEDSSGLVSMSLESLPDGKAGGLESILSSFYGTPFNSVNDVIVHPEDKSIWFTDPCYGHCQGIRATPQLPNQVYRFDPATKAVRAVADGFSRPNGLCFSPDNKTLYVTDTGAINGSPDVPIDPAGPSHIYAFDVSQASGTFLTNRRLFAYAPGRFPDGIKCDMKGNVYAGCGDGVEVWNPAGDLLGCIKVPGGVANFCFGEAGTLYVCNETRFWKVSLSGAGVRGALLGI